MRMDCLGICAYAAQARKGRYRCMSRREERRITPSVGSNLRSLALALPGLDEEAPVLRVVDVEQHRRAERRLRLGALASLEQDRA